jgi:hypothetical protein
MMMVMQQNQTRKKERKTEKNNVAQGNNGKKERKTKFSKKGWGGKTEMDCRKAAEKGREEKAQSQRNLRRKDGI